MSAGRQRWTRSCVILSTAATGCHLVLVAEGGDSTPLMSIVMVLLMAACARCSFRLWKSPSDRSATAMLVVTCSMLIAHYVLLGFGHVHGVPNASGASAASDLTRTGDLTPVGHLDVFSFAASALELAVVVLLAFSLRKIHQRLDASPPGVLSAPANQASTGGSAWRGSSIGSLGESIAIDSK